MAKSDAVWGIDIGQCALKALRCRPHEKDDNRLVVEAFDYIEYPKILTQPEANRDELIREALQQFVSRNDLTGERVAIAVPGQSGLARFIKLPPVERKKIPDIVKYEARQQIPFALEDVVWDYQPLIGSEDEGYAIETEVGLFAMKRDQVARHLKPLEEAGIPVEIIQLAPLSIYNFVCFDRLNIEGAYDPANPPQSTVIISLGTDTTDLVITNGYRVWQRSIPIGGNHFTKSLTKELKLTFAKAEHLKRNAMKAENPKAVFQAMRPVFSDLVAEIQRSLGFFTSNNRNAKLGDMIALGNPMKLPGLQRFLSQNLDQPVKLIDNFEHLVGGTATAGPQFKENQLTFGVAYGLCVQALEKAQLRTNLLPDEIITERLVKAKKPWAVAAVALLMLGLTVNYFAHYGSLLTANVDDQDMKSALTKASTVKKQADDFTSENAKLIEKFNQVVTTAHNLQSNVDGRLLWLELIKAIQTALPKNEIIGTADPKTTMVTLTGTHIVSNDDKGRVFHLENGDHSVQGDYKISDCNIAAKTWTLDRNPTDRKGKSQFTGKLESKDTEADIAKRPELHITAMECEYYADLAPSLAFIQKSYIPLKSATPAAPAAGAASPDAAAAGAATPPTAPAPGQAAPAPGAPASATPPTSADAAAPPTDATAAPTGDAAASSAGGWVIELRGYHLHNNLVDKNVVVGDEADAFVNNTFIKNLQTMTVKLPDGTKAEMIDVPIADLGIKNPAIVTSYRVEKVLKLPESAAENGAPGATPVVIAGPEAAAAGPGAAAADQTQKPLELRQYDFIIQFAWTPTPRSARMDKTAAKKAAANTTAEAGTTPIPTGS